LLRVQVLLFIRLRLVNTQTKLPVVKYHSCISKVYSVVLTWV